MAHYSIISSQSGAATLWTGAPKYVGAYLKPGYLEFPAIGSPTAIAWHVGDYVVYSRTGKTYRLYRTPQAAEQGVASKYGASFLYENVQFFDDSKQLEFCPFTDLVPGDNTVHFSTQNTVSFFGKPANVAERIQACLEAQYGAGSWEIRIVTTSDPDLLEILNTEIEFSVTGANCQDVLDKVYDEWGGLGWIHTVENGKNIITIGASNVRTAANTTVPFAFDNGLVRVQRSIANADQIGTRLFAYGSMKNMDATYYRGLDIYHAESVDIEHLMIPIASWGITDGKPDARKAFIQDAAAIAALGLIPRTAYFDGSGDLPDIHPTIERMTIGEVYDAGGAGYVPDLSKWDRDDRIDEIVAATNPTDHGTSAEQGQKYSEIVSSHLDTVSASNQEGQIDQKIWEGTTTKAGRLTLKLGSNNQTFTMMSGWTNPEFSGLQMEVLINGTERASIPLDVVSPGAPTWTVKLPDTITIKDAPAGTIAIYVFGYVLRNQQDTYANARTYTFSTDATTPVSVKVEYEIAKTFVVRIPQIGFDIDDYADLGNGKTVSMKTGMCAGRDFQVKDAAYVPSADAWDLTLYRSIDEDLNIMFPNADYEIAAGDQYVLLDIAMPEMYVTVASSRLLAAAQKLLADICVEKPFYAPQIDAKVVYNESRLLREGMWMDITQEGNREYVLIDSITIDENSSNIPTYEVALREKKGIDWTENIGKSSSSRSSQSVVGRDTSDAAGSVTSVGLEVPVGMVVEGSPITSKGTIRVSLADGYVIPKEKDVGYFEPDTTYSGGIKLRAAYGGVRVPGIRFGIGRTDFDLEVRNIAGEGETPVWVLYSPLPLITEGDQIVHSGTPGSGGGGSATYLHELLDVIPQLSPSDGYLLAWDANAQSQAGTIGAWKAISQSSIMPDLSNYYTKHEVDGMVEDIGDAMDNLQAQIDAVSSRDMFDELTASVFFADIIAASDIYGALHGDADNALSLEGHAASYFAAASDVTALENNFDSSGNAKAALKLTTSGPLNIWGVQYWNNGIPSDVTGRPNLYIGSTQVQTVGNTQPLGGISTITLVAQSTRSTSGNVIEVVTESDGQGGTITYLHTTLPIISDGDQIVGTGTPGGGGGGGATYLHELLDVIDNLSPSDGYVLAWDASAMSQAGSTGAWKAISQSSLRPDLSNYYTKAETYSQAEVNALIGAIDQFHYEIAASTSAVVDPQSNVLYLIGPTGSGADKYEEYVYTNSTWTKIGDTSIDLSNYYTKSETYSKTEVDTALNGYVPTTRTVSGTGYLTGGGALSQNQTLDIASTVKTKIDHGESAYSALPDINALLDNLQAQVDAVSSRDCYDELTATVFYSDIVAATDIYGALHGDADNALNLEGHAASYFATASAVTTLQGYFDNSGNAKTALKLTTDGPLNLWGVEYWSSGIPKSVTGRPSFGAGADVPAGQTFKIGDATFSWVAGSNDNPGYLYVDAAFMSAGDQIIGSGTPGQGGGGGGKNYLQELLDTAYGWSDAFLAGVSEQQVLVFTPGADSKNGTGTGAWSYVPKTAVGAFYTAGTGLALSNANVFSLDVNAAKTALGLGDAAYLGVASAIGSSVTGLVSGALLYGVLGDSFDSTNTVKAFVNSSIATATATFRGTNTTATTEAAFLTWANALTHDLNDYVFWQTTDSYGNTIYKRYKFDGTSWVFEYNLNNSSFTTAQWDAINSGITSTKRSGYDTIVGYFTNGQLQAAHVGDLSGTYLSKSGGSMNNTTVVTNLNADLLDGKHANEFAAATHSHTISQVTNLESNLDTLSARIDSVGSRNEFDELAASVFTSDLIVATTIYGALVGNAGTASNASQLEGHAASYFATASSLNSYLLLSGGRMTGELYVNYSNDVAPSGGGSLIIGTKTSTNLAMDDNEIMARNNGAVSVLYLNAEGGNVIINETAGNTGIGVSSPAAKLSVGGSIELYSAGSSWNEGIRMHPATNGWSGIVFCEASNSGSTGTSANTWSIHNHEGVFGMYKNGSNKSDTNSYLDNTSGAWGMGGNLTIAGSLVTSGDQTISSDETLKMNLEDIRLSAKDIAGVRAVTFDWKDGRGRSFGTIAQDWLGILPEAVSGEEGNYSVAYAQAAMVAAVVNSREIVEIEKRETERDKEIRELKAALGKANVRITDLEKEVERLRMN